MNAKLYADTVTDLPLLEETSETLSDGSVVWNLIWDSKHVIPCISEKHADKAFDAIAAALKKSTNDNVVVD